MDEGSLSRSIEVSLELVLDSEAASEIGYSSQISSSESELLDWDLDSVR